MNRFKDKKVELFVFAMLIISLIIVSIFHEPWFDEAQAWQIARCASLRDILFLIPHYEGHPALWHLILCIPAKLGLPYEISLNVISLIAPILSGYLILFYSPFPRVIRCLLPFHYFLFYQYGVICRPYGYMVLAIILIALQFRKKDEHPVRFVLTMLFLCLLGAYGILVAGGISAAWLFDICQEKHWKIFSKDFGKDLRVLTLMALLLCTMLIMVQIMPYPTTSGVSIEVQNSVFVRLLYAVFAMLPDCLFMNIFMEGGYLQNITLVTSNLVLGCIVGLIMLVIMICLSKKHDLKYFLLPYVTFSLFAGIVYLYAHHIGIMYGLFLYWAWISWGGEREERIFVPQMSDLKCSEEMKKILPICVKLVVAYVLCMPIVWTVVASWHDIRLPYFWGREAAQFIKDNDLEDASMMARWENDDINDMWIIIGVLPYLDHTPCLNLNMGQEDRAFVIHLTADDEDVDNALSRIAQIGYPDFTIGKMTFRGVPFEEEAPEYVLGHELSPIWVGIWKNQLSYGNYESKIGIYVKKDLSK
jgi:hypothetical protein